MFGKELIMLKINLTTILLCASLSAGCAASDQTSKSDIAGVASEQDSISAQTEMKQKK
jgi:hypothetical protein